MNSLLQHVLARPSNSSEPRHSLNSTSIQPTALFETIIPGYKPIHDFILATFSVDITLLVTFLAILWGLSKLWSYVWNLFYGLVAAYFRSSITITNHDDIHSHMIKWLASQPKLRTSRSLIAETDVKSAWEVDEDSIVTQTTTNSAGVQFLNFSNQEAKAPPRFTPAFGNHQFWHNGTYFTLQRALSSALESSGTLTLTEKEEMIISCLGRSPDPIKSLLQDAKNFYHQEHDAKTVIRRPAPKDMRRHGGRYSWTQVASRPCRPMETVVLEADRKMEVLSDINEYLHPATPRWYANRGIPYRRGYLFHGPPGTGKTSLSFALAGVFGLDIYVISLLESTITEEDLSQLFNSLPRRCVVLLEDIDTAGLTRLDDAKADADESKSVQSTASDVATEGWKIVSTDIAKAFKKANHQAKEDDKKGISLSGLLNAIDGVASHEGRVLVMTTNKPDSLDSALIRPGRVDLQVAFTNATRSQIKELFERMYTSDDSRVRPDTKHLPKSSPTMSITSKGPAETMLEAGFDYEARSLEDCAEEFSDSIPDGVLSPAEVQGFLLKRKKEPQRACREVGKWVESMLAVRDGGGKVLNVQ